MSDSNIIQFVSRAHASEPTSPELHAESLRQTRERLEEADSIARELRSIPRIPERDRPLLAPPSQRPR
jgi:hypothetical protein